MNFACLKTLGGQINRNDIQLQAPSEKGIMAKDKTKQQNKTKQHN